MFLEILITAFFLQLVALPGEKGQFIISSLATQYNPWAVAGGASVAFAGWTVIEILVGTALKNILPKNALEIMTAALLILFAGWLIYGIVSSNSQSTETEHDEEVFGYDVPSFFEGVVPAFSFMAVGEFGDKTQLITITLAAQYGATSAIWFGEMFAIIPFSIANAVLFSRVGHRINRQYLRAGSALIFLAFAADIILGVLIGVSVLPL